VQGAAFQPMGDPVLLLGGASREAADGDREVVKEEPDDLARRVVTHDGLKFADRLVGWGVHPPMAANNGGDGKRFFPS
jgi:hypothetical protein